MAVHPLPVRVLAALITAAVTYKIATKPRVYEANVVLALTEGATGDRSTIPFDQLRGYVASVLMPDAKLKILVEKRNLHRLRRKFGEQYALTELREQIEIEIWKNTFLIYDEGEANTLKSARIGLTVTEGDPDLAFELAHDLASIVIESHEEQRKKVADYLARDVNLMREKMSARLADVETAISVKQTAAITAKQDGKLGLTTTLTVVEERRPPPQEQSLFVLIIVAVVVGTGALIGSAVFLGAFDSRVHDTDDISRLGLPVLGHVPGFPGDHVGSLGARGARRARVPSFKRWRSQR